MVCGSKADGRHSVYGAVYSYLRNLKISRNPDDAGRNCWEQSGQELLRGKGHREGFCGTRKSAETRTMPEGIAGSRADRNCFVGKGIGRVFAGLENQQKPGRCRKELLGAERTGIASWERASGGFLRDSK